MSDVAENDDDDIVRRTRDVPAGLSERMVRTIREVQEQFNRFTLNHPLEAAPIRREIAREVQAYVDATKSCVLRFFQLADGVTPNAVGTYGVVCFRPELPKVIQKLDSSQLQAARDCLEALLGVSSEKVGAFYAPLIVLYESLGKALKPVFELIPDSVSRVLLVPMGELWSFPLHIGMVHDRPLCAHKATSYCSSLTGLVYHARHRSLEASLAGVQLRVCTSFDKPADSALFGSRAIQRPGVRVLGPGINDFKPVTWENLRDFICGANEQTVFLINCHGAEFVDSDARHVCLVFNNYPNATERHSTEYLTPEQIGLMPTAGMSFPLVVLAACVSGQGVGLSGGEVSGFYRATVAMGASTSMLSFWPVGSNAVDEFTDAVLKCAATRPIIDAYREAAEQGWSQWQYVNPGKALMNGCCLGLFV